MTYAQAPTIKLVSNFESNSWGLFEVIRTASVLSKIDQSAHEKSRITCVFIKPVAIAQLGTKINLSTTVRVTTTTTVNNQCDCDLITINYDLSQLNIPMYVYKREATSTCSFCSIILVILQKSVSSCTCSLGTFNRLVHVF